MLKDANGMESMNCPEWWPLPDGRPIGEKRAPELIKYIRGKAVPVIEIAKSYLQQRHPTQEIKVRESQAASIAKLSLARQMTAIPIATVSSGKGADAHIVRIALDREGHIIANLSKPSEPVMRSVSM
jgi:hypothetical protein